MHDYDNRNTMFVFPLSSYLVPATIGTLLLILTSSCSDIGPPERPRDVAATALNQHYIQITWTCVDEEYYDWWGNISGAAVSYYVYRDGERVTSIGDPEYQDGNLAPETLYCYRVTSYWDDNVFDWFYTQESGLSQEACAWTYPLNTVSGTVTLDSAGLENVQMELIRSTGFPVVVATTITQPTGGYTFDDLENSQYTLVPSLPGYTFSPEQHQVTLFNENAAGVDFSALAVP